MKTLTYIACFFALLFLIGSCKKNTDTSVNIESDHFLIANYAMYLPGTKAFEIKGGQLYRDTVMLVNGVMTMKPLTLNNGKYALVDSLRSSLPQYLNDHPNQTFGCPNCVDQGGYYIEITQNGQLIHWYIDTSIASLPTDIRAYVTKLSATIKQL